MTTLTSRPIHMNKSCGISSRASGKEYSRNQPDRMDCECSKWSMRFTSPRALKWRSAFDGCVDGEKNLPMTIRFPVSRPYIHPDDVQFVSKILSEAQVSGRAPVVRQFERSFSEYLGTKHALASCNGTAGLHLAVKALRMKAGDEVIVPAFTMMSPIFSLLYEGLKPVLVDVDKVHWIMNTIEIER